MDDYPDQTDLAEKAAAAMPEVNPALVAYAIEALTNSKIPVTLSSIEWAEVMGALNGLANADDVSPALTQRAKELRDEIGRQVELGVRQLGATLVMKGAFENVDVADFEAILKRPDHD